MVLEVLSLDSCIFYDSDHDRCISLQALPFRGRSVSLLGF